MSELRNWLERLGEKIPGYSGYVQHERRRDIDKLHREHLADRLRSLKTPLTDVLRDLTSGGRLLEVGPIDRVQKKLDQIENRVRFATYGYSGFFDTVKIEDEQLDSIYQFDLALVEKVESLEAKVRDVKTRAGEAGTLKTAVADVESAVDELNRTFDERRRAIDAFGDGQSPGQPMFS